MACAERKAKYIYELPYKEERELCTILDLNDRWEELGGKYMEYAVLELYAIKRIEKCGKSPTRRLLQLWGQKNNTILKLYYYLYQMQHYQAMTVLEPFVPKMYHILEQDTDMTRAFKALEKTAPSSTNSTYLASSENVATSRMHDPIQSRHTNSNTHGAQPHGSRMQNSSINLNLNLSSLSVSNQEAEKSINKVPDSLLQPLRQADIESQNNRKKFTPSTCENEHANACNIQSGRSTLLSGTSCEENNCTKCQKKINTAVEHYSREYRQKVLEKFPNLIPSEKLTVAKTPPTVQLISNKPTPNTEIKNSQRDVTSIPKKLHSSRSDTSVLSDCSVPMIPFEDLNSATESFSYKNLLGKGGFGSVYKATWKLSKVAVKKIYLETETVIGTVGIEINQSLDELRYLQSFRHKNILQVFGFSADEGKPTCLVYEFMENGSLEDRLQCKRKFGESRRSSFVEPLSWENRLKIMLGTASALQYLHTVREKPIIHGDVKSANILLEKDFEPKLGDFGLAREGPNSHYTSVKVSRVNGTRAYIPNEYLRDRKLSTKVDTYSFGVVLFEVCSGQRAYDDKRKPQYLRAYIDEATDVKSLIDPKAGTHGKMVFDDLLELGKHCTNDKHIRRPDMVTVYKQICAIEIVLKDQQRRFSEEQSTSNVMSVPHPSYIYPPASPGSNYMQYVMRPVQIIQPQYHIPLAPPVRQVQMLPPKNENISPSPTTSPSVIAEESAEISDEYQNPQSETSNSDFLPLLTDIGKKNSFLD